jgi:hypothetical protein
MRIMNKIYYLFMSMTVILLASCSQEEVEQVKEDTPALLKVMVNQSAQPSTRASISDLSTAFEEGDQIGLFAIDEGSDELIYVNVPYTYNGTTWEVSNPSQKVYFSENFKYFAYYPYQEKIEDEYYSFEDDDTAYWYYTLYYYTEDASEFFEYLISKWEPQSDQSTKENFNASDLMVGKGTKNNENASVSFTLNHQMGLIRISIYPTPDANTPETLNSNENYSSYFPDNPPYYNGIDNYLYYIAKPSDDKLFTFKTAEGVFSAYDAQGAQISVTADSSYVYQGIICDMSFAHKIMN